MGLERKFRITSFNFNNFYKKEYNEQFVIDVLRKCLNYRKIIKGNPTKNEPDIICDDVVPIEITLISDHRKQMSLIKRLNLKASKRPFDSPDIIEEIENGLRESIVAKTSKNYCYDKVNLCLISPLPIDTWINEKIRELSILFSIKSLNYLDEIKRQYLRKGNIDNIYILIPTYDSRWCLIDLGSDRHYYYKGNTNDKSYPYFELVDMEITYE